MGSGPSPGKLNREQAARVLEHRIGLLDAKDRTEGTKQTAWLLLCLAANFEGMFTVLQLQREGRGLPMLALMREKCSLWAGFLSPIRAVVRAG